MKYDGRYSLKDALIEADTKELDEGIIGDVMGKIGGALKKKLKGMFGGDSGTEFKEMSLGEAGKATQDADQQLFMTIFFELIDGGKKEAEAEAEAKKEMKTHFEEQIKTYAQLELSKTKGDDKGEEK
tara:strand:- start:1943 stop:2323 length:381 start_codon:yes stop_codon:yes gene_type:complete